MKKLTLICLLITTFSLAQKIKTGAENYGKYLPLLKGKNIGVVTNKTSTINGKTHLVDFLLAKNVKIKTIFAPEHGFRGTADAGEHLNDEIDAKTALPIVSLYGKNRKPKPEQLQGIDVVVFDIQDVGSRFYTFISTLHIVMEACAENNITILVLDRPNPAGSIVDGPILEKEFSSFVGMDAIPILHGMTFGEYAKMLNGEKWLENGVQCKLIVIECKNYKREMHYSLPIKPSPNLPNDQSVNLYASLCLFEGTNVSVGRGTESQFQIYGSPYLPKSDFVFMPKPNFGAKEPTYNGILCYGEDLTQYPKLDRIELKWLIKAYNSTSDKSSFFNPFFTKLAGTKKLQEQIEAFVTEEGIRNSWKVSLDNFKKIRTKYLIYK